MMAFGRPDILDPKFEIRPIQAAIRAARQRIETIEAAVTVLQATAAPGTLPTIASLQAQVAALANRVAVLGDQADAAATDDPVSTQLAMEAKMRSIARAAVRGMAPPNSATAVLMARMFSQR